jgi:4'-phosphopantetheinyl transferase
LPLTERIEIDHLRMSIWEITEDMDAILQLVARVHRDPDIHHSGRNIQWLACRAALAQILENPDAKVYKDDYGKPHIDSGGHISLTHTHKYAAAIVSNNLVGIDIEEITPRIERIAHRFLHSTERDMLTDENKLKLLYLIWCAKEAMYKLYGKRSVDFAENIRVLPFQIAESGAFNVEFIKDGIKVYKANYRFFNNHALVWVEDS